MANNTNVWQEDWSNLFAAPIHPDVFQSLEQNGLLSFNNQQKQQSKVNNRQAIPPSLWMSPASPPSNNSVSHQSIHDLPSNSPNSPISDSKSTLLSEMLSDDLFSQQNPPLSPQPTSTFTSPRLPGSPDLKPCPDSEADPDLLAKEDPLATQVWRLYARTKGSLPHAQRMENLSWRMMALALKKKKEEEAAAAGHLSESSFYLSPCAESPPRISQSLPQQPFYSHSPPNERGRRIDKGKARVHVIGFDTMQHEEPQSECALFSPPSSFSR